MKRLQLNKIEMAALVMFWKTYMNARKGYEAYQEASRLSNAPLDYKLWLDYNETKQGAFQTLRKVIPDINYITFWRAVVSLKPEVVIEEIMMYRHNKEIERQQRQSEKQILIGAK
jgi:glycerol-3-phosphate acyltransferase PlsY